MPLPLRDGSRFYDVDNIQQGWRNALIVVDKPDLSLNWGCIRRSSFGVVSHKVVIEPSMSQSLLYILYLGVVQPFAARRSIVTPTNLLRKHQSRRRAVQCTV